VAADVLSLSGVGWSLNSGLLTSISPFCTQIDIHTLYTTVASYEIYEELYDWGKVPELYEASEGR